VAGESSAPATPRRHAQLLSYLVETEARLGAAGLEHLPEARILHEEGVPDHFGERFSQPFSVTATVASCLMHSSPGT
jgi:hypothetical protein